MLSGQRVTRGHVSTQSHRATQVIWTPRVPDASHWGLESFQAVLCLCVLGEHTDTYTLYAGMPASQFPSPLGPRE